MAIGRPFTPTAARRRPDRRHGLGLPDAPLDDNLWAQAARAATGFCRARGYSGGFMNWHQAPTATGWSASGVLDLRGADHQRVGALSGP